MPHINSREFTYTQFISLELVVQKFKYKIFKNRRRCTQKYLNWMHLMKMIIALLNSIVRFDVCLSSNAVLLFLEMEIYHFHFSYSLSSMAPHSQLVSIVLVILFYMKSSCQFCQQHIPKVNN